MSGVFQGLRVPTRRDVILRFVKMSAKANQGHPEGQLKIMAIFSILDYA